MITPTLLWPWGVWVDLDHLRRLTEILGHKWDLVILARLAERPLRYMELARQIRQIDADLTDGVLSKKLKLLTANGLIRRQRANRYHVYALTTRGQHLVGVLVQIAEFDDETPPDDPEPGDDQ